MRRANPKKKKSNPSVTVTAKQLERIKRETAKAVTDKACLVVLAATVDELGLDEDQLCRIMERTDRYARYIDDHIAKMEDIKKTIEKSTGIILHGWT